MALINSHQEKTHVLPGYTSEVAMEKKKTNQLKGADQNLTSDLGEVPAHAMDENGGIPLSAKESKFVWLAIIMGQIILALIIYAIL